MTDDWQRLGDVVARIAQRLEGPVIARAPIPEADALLFLRVMSGDIFAPVRTALPEQGSGQAGDGDHDAA